MAERLAKSSDIGEYIAYPYTASQALAPIDSGAHGHFFGGVLIGTLGTGLTITISNGTTQQALITPTVPDFIGPQWVCDKGLQVALTGTGFSVTVLAMDMAV